MYFVLFAAAIFALLWLLQTVFLQRFYNGMLETNTRKAAAEIVSKSGTDNIAEEIDRLSLDNSLLVFVTEPDSTILYSSDSYKSYYRSSDQDDSEDNPYMQGETLSWQKNSYRNLPDGYEAFLTALNDSAAGETELKSDTQYVYGTYVDLNDGTKAVLYVSTALGSVGAAASVIRIQLVWVTVFSLLIAFVIAWFLAEKFATPIAQLSQQAKMLANDSYTPLFEKGFCTELDELDDAMDETAGKLSLARKYQKELLANVSHDLRTPLTMIKGYAEMIRDVSWQDEEARNADTAIIIRETDRLTALVNEILEYSKLQEVTEYTFSPVDISALLKTVIAQFEPLMSQQGIAIEQEIEENCTANGDAALLERMIYNLIDNALRHTREKITVRLRQDDEILLEVQDYGDGIDEAELPYIFEKYYTSRQRGNKGVSGLGLAIVKRIAEIHDARYGAESTKGEGSRFCIIIKKQ